LSAAAGRRAGPADLSPEQKKREPKEAENVKTGEKQLLSRWKVRLSASGRKRLAEIRAKRVRVLKQTVKY